MEYTVPYLTDDQRRENLRIAKEVRAERAALMKALKRGEVKLADVLDSPVMARARLRTVLNAVPGVGDEMARAIMSENRIMGNRRVRGVGSRQREALFAALSEVKRAGTVL